MIAYIEGRLAEVCANACVVVTEGGVGYEVFVPQQTLLALPARGSLVRFYTCHIVREDAQELYGFETWDERQTFLVLISISKVGARTALRVPARRSAAAGRRGRCIGLDAGFRDRQKECPAYLLGTQV